MKLLKLMGADFYGWGSFSVDYQSYERSGYLSINSSASVLVRVCFVSGLCRDVPALSANVVR